MKNIGVAAVAVLIVVAGAAGAWFQWFAGGLGSPEEIHQQLLGEWYSYRQGDFGPMHATEHLEVFEFLDTSDRVTLADGSNDVIHDVIVSAYVDKTPGFINTATLESRLSAADLRQIHTIGTTYEVYDDQLVIHMGGQRMRLYTIRELGPERMVWTVNDKPRVLLRRDIYESLSREELANIFNVSLPDAGSEM